MPYSGADDSNLPEHVKKLPDKLRRQWVAVFNSALEQYGDEGKAHKIANGVVKKAQEATMYPLVDDGLPVNYENIEARRWKKDVIRVGTYKHPKGKWTLKVTPDRMDKWVANFKAMKEAGIRVPAPLDHSKKSIDNWGWVDDVWREGDVLKATFDIVHPDETEAAKIGTTIREVSVSINPFYVDGTGKAWGEAIEHIAPCTLPIVPGQGEFEPIAARRVDADTMDAFRSDETVAAEVAGGLETMAETHQLTNEDVWDYVEEYLSRVSEEESVDVLDAVMRGVDLFISKHPEYDDVISREDLRLVASGLLGENIEATDLPTQDPNDEDVDDVTHSEAVEDEVVKTIKSGEQLFQKFIGSTESPTVEDIKRFLEAEEPPVQASLDFIARISMTYPALEEPLAEFLIEYLASQDGLQARLDSKGNIDFGLDIGDLALPGGILLGGYLIFQWLAKEAKKAGQAVNDFMLGKLIKSWGLPKFVETAKEAVRVENKFVRDKLIKSRGLPKLLEGLDRDEAHKAFPGIGGWISPAENRLTGDNNKEFAWAEILTVGLAGAAIYGLLKALGPYKDKLREIGAEAGAVVAEMADDAVALLAGKHLSAQGVIVDVSGNVLTTPIQTTVAGLRLDESDTHDFDLGRVATLGAVGAGVGALLSILGPKLVKHLRIGPRFISFRALSKEGLAEILAEAAANGIEGVKVDEALNKVRIDFRQSYELSSMQDWWGSEISRPKPFTYSPFFPRPNKVKDWWNKHIYRPNASAFGPGGRLLPPERWVASPEALEIEKRIIREWKAAGSPPPSERTRNALDRVAKGVSAKITGGKAVAIGDIGEGGYPSFWDRVKKGLILGGIGAGAAIGIGMLSRVIRGKIKTLLDDYDLGYKGVFYEKDSAKVTGMNRVDAAVMVRAVKTNGGDAYLKSGGGGYYECVVTDMPGAWATYVARAEQSTPFYQFAGNIFLQGSPTAYDIDPDSGTRGVVKVKEEPHADEKAQIAGLLDWARKQGVPSRWDTAGHLLMGLVKFPIREGLNFLSWLRSLGQKYGHDWEHPKIIPMPGGRVYLEFPTQRAAKRAFKHFIGGGAMASIDKNTVIFTAQKSLRNVLDTGRFLLRQFQIDHTLGEVYCLRAWDWTYSDRADQELYAVAAKMSRVLEALVEKATSTKQGGGIWKRISRKGETWDALRLEREATDVINKIINDEKLNAYEVIRVIERVYKYLSFQYIGYVEAVLNKFYERARQWTRHAPKSILQKVRTTGPKPGEPPESSHAVTEKIDIDGVVVGQVIGTRRYECANKGFFVNTGNKPPDMSLGEYLADMVDKWIDEAGAEPIEAIPIVDGLINDFPEAASVLEAYKTIIRETSLRRFALREPADDEEWAPIACGVGEGDVISIWVSVNWSAGGVAEGASPNAFSAAVLRAVKGAGLTGLSVDSEQDGPRQTALVHGVADELVLPAALEGTIFNALKSAGYPVTGVEVIEEVAAFGLRYKYQPFQVLLRQADAEAPKKAKKILDNAGFSDTLVEGLRGDLLSISLRVGGRAEADLENHEDEIAAALDAGGLKTFDVIAIMKEETRDV